MGALTGEFWLFVLYKNSGPGLVGVISGVGVLTEGVLSGVHCISQRLPRSKSFKGEKNVNWIGFVKFADPKMSLALAVDQNRSKHQAW